MRMPLFTSCAIIALMFAVVAHSGAQERSEFASEPGAQAPASPSSDAERGNTVCPVMPDEPIDPNFFTLYKGRKVYLCCKRCRTKFEADPEAYAANLPPQAKLAALQETDGGAAPEGDRDQQRDESSEHDANFEHAAQGAHTHEEGLVRGKEESDERSDARDHSAHAESASGLTKTLSYIGRFHVLVTHFPIALLLFGALFEVVSILGAGANARAVVRASVDLGAVSAIAASALGLMNAIGAEYSGALSDVFWWHRLLGLSTAGVAVAAAMAVEWRARKPSSKVNNSARIAVFATAALVGITGHLGGSLVFGWEYLVP